MELTMNGFKKMSHQEMMDVDGGNRRRNVIIGTGAGAAGALLPSMGAAAVSAKKGAKWGAAVGAIGGPKGAIVGGLIGGAIGGLAGFLVS